MAVIGVVLAGTTPSYAIKADASTQQLTAKIDAAKLLTQITQPKVADTKTTIKIDNANTLAAPAQSC